MCVICDCFCGYKTTLEVKAGIESSVLNTGANNLTTELYIHSNREIDTLLQTLCLCTQETQGFKKIPNNKHAEAEKDLYNENSNTLKITD